MINVITVYDKQARSLSEDLMKLEKRASTAVKKIHENEKLLQDLKNERSQKANKTQGIFNNIILVSLRKIRTIYLKHNQ